MGDRALNRKRVALLFLLPLCLNAQKFYTYVGQIGTQSVLLAWGTAEGAGNKIGRTSTSYGKASVKVGDQTVTSDQNWIVVGGLRPDTEYPYQVLVNDKKIGEGKVRTYPEKSNRLLFFVIGDWGTGTSAQYKVAEAMEKEFERRNGMGDPVRFVLTTGDNIYSDVSFGALQLRSGDEDWHWKNKFFDPYQQLIRQIPFYPTLGNHDGNAGNARGDLTVYLDNFFFPEGTPARYYRFSFGGLVEFFALDSTDNTATGPPAPAYSKDGAQFGWLKEYLPASKAPWKIPYFHHPPFGGGPRHEPSYEALRHFLEVFQQSGVKVVFTGHEHNFQFTEQNEATGGICYVITGAGGELGKGSILRDMQKANIAGWAPQHHFLVVEIQDRTLKVTPLSYEPVIVKDKSGKQINMPLVLNLK